MAEEKYSRDWYDLYYNRDLDAFCHEHDSWFSPEKADVQWRRRQLDQLSERLRDILEKRDALIFCQHFLTSALTNRSNGPRSAISPASFTALPPSRPDAEDEIRKLRARLSFAERDNFLEQVQIQNLKQLSDAVRMRCWENTTWPPDPPLFFRIHRPSSHTFYDKDVGFCCPKWLQERDFGETWQDEILDFYGHVNGYMGLYKTPAKTFGTPYISMTSSPSRALNLVRKHEMTCADVFIIDPKRLWATNVQLERTTTIMNHHKIKLEGRVHYGRPHYVTETHWVAKYWIPSDCIVARMSFHQFQRVCHSKAIFRGTSFPSHRPRPQA